MRDKSEREHITAGKLTTESGSAAPVNSQNARNTAAILPRRDCRPPPAQTDVHRPPQPKPQSTLWLPEKVQ